MDDLKAELPWNNGHDPDTDEQIMVITLNRYCYLTQIWYAQCGEFLAVTVIWKINHQLIQLFSSVEQ